MEMIFKSKIGVTFLISFILWVILTIGFFVLSFVSNIWLLIVSVSFLPFVFYFISAIKTKAFYEITDDFLFIKSGKYEQKIPYSNITGFARIKSMLMVPTTSSFVRLEIKHKNLQGIGDFTHISPKNESEFASLLNSKISA